MIKKLLFISTMLFLFITSADAALITRINDQAIYDDDLNITWISNMNLAASNSFGIAGIGDDGTMSWEVANQWIDALNGNNYLGFNDWRLPQTIDPDPSCEGSFNCTGSEMGHLFYNELGGNAGEDILLGGTPGCILCEPDPDVALFSNIQTGTAHYWSGTVFFADEIFTMAWDFEFGTGSQNVNLSEAPWNVTAVRTGDILATPIPPAIWLFVSGFLGLISLSRLKH